MLYVNSNEMAWAVELAENTGDQSSGKGIYESQCTICHRDDMKVSPPLFPPIRSGWNSPWMKPRFFATSGSPGTGRTT